MQTLLQTTLLRFRLPLILLGNIALTALGLWLSLYLRYEFEADHIDQEMFLLPFLSLLFFRSAAYVYWNLNQGYWRYVSTSDLSDILKSHLVSSACFAASIFLFRIPEFPRSVIFIEFALSVLASGGSRLLVRLVCERLLAQGEDASSRGAREVIILGAGDSGHLLVKILNSHRRMGYRPVAVLDDSERMRGVNVFGIPVLGPISKLAEILQHSPRIGAVMLAIPSYSAERFQELSSFCKKFGVPLKRVQSFEDIACLDAAEPRQEFTIESFLDKEVAVEHEDEIRQALEGSSVLVTGAGGSIGSELVRQIAQFAPRSIVLFDSGEYNLFKIRQEFHSQYPNVKKHFVLGSICDDARLQNVFKRFEPDVVFHAAAYKHVPLLEDNCYEAFWNNIIGTRNLLNRALQSTAKRFVMISTDKAVDPSSIMGASKRIAEVLTQQACALARSINRNDFNAAVVRFGNVINSAGSVIPLFKEQILSGGPVTVTHPEMERYFMSIREAVRLVLTAGTLGAGGEIYILNMGAPIRIVDVARKMLALYGRRDIPIVFTGVRPGEKLSERLTNHGEIRESTRLAKVNLVVNASAMNIDAFSWVADIENRLEKLDDEAMGKELLSFLGVITQNARESFRNSGQFPGNVLVNE